MLLITATAPSIELSCTPFWDSLTPSDWIQLCGIIVSAIASLVAIIISILTLRQNNKMVEESTRPYIIVYTGTTNFQSPSYYLIVKNFGQTGARITSFSSDFDLSKCSYNPKNTPFKHIENTFIAPNQSFACNVNPVKLFEYLKPLTINISYEAGNKTYTDSFILNIEADFDIVHTRACSNNKELRTISYALQDIAEKML